MVDERMPTTRISSGWPRFTASATLAGELSLVGGVFVPRNHQRHGRHEEDSGNTDNEMHHGAAGDLGQQEVPRERQEYAEAENLQRMLAAQDQRPQPDGFQSGP